MRDYLCQQIIFICVILHFVLLFEMDEGVFHSKKTKNKKDKILYQIKKWEIERNQLKSK